MNPEISSDSNQNEARARVRRVRRASRIAQGPIATKADMDVATLCRWELGQVTLSPEKITEIEQSLLEVIADRLATLSSELMTPASRAQPCVRQAMAVIDQGRLLLEEAVTATGSSAHARRLRRLANGFVALHDPLAVIAGNCGGDEVPQ